MFIRGLKASSGAIIVVTVMLLANGLAMAIGIQPLIMEMNVRAGEERDFEIKLLPGDSEEFVDLTLYEPVQQLNGSLVYQLPTHPAFSATSWVTIDEQTVRVLPGAESKVTGRVRIPFSASGSHTVIVMVEPRPTEVDSMISFQVRYAVRLNIQVERAGIRPTAELTFLEVAPDGQRAPRIAARIKNTSTLDYPVSGEVTIRDQERRLVERVSLQTQAGSSTQAMSTRIYPGAEVEFSGYITRPLAPGEYWMQTFMRYGDTGQILQNDTLVIVPDVYKFPGFEEQNTFTVNPVVAEHALLAGERRSQIFEFESLVGDPIRIELALDEAIAGDHSLVDWMELRSQSEFMLPGRARTRLAMTVGVPRDAIDGSYHGKAVFRAYSDLSNELLTEVMVPLNVFVGTDHQPSVTLRSIVAKNTTEAETYLSLDFQNSGNVSLKPQVVLVILSEEGEYVRRVSLALPEGVSELLPSETRQLEVFIPKLELGGYEVEIEVINAGLNILSEQRQFRVIE